MRYSNDDKLSMATKLGTAKAARILRLAHSRGQISTTTVVMGQDLRLDILAYRYLGNPTYWWTIAALSNIGWAMQLPPGTRLIVPTNADQIEALF